MDTMLVIDDSNKPTTFQEFPPEIIHMIFNYLTGDDVLKSFLHLNNRFNSIIKNSRLKTFDLSRWTHQEITNLFKTSFHDISSYCHSLKITNKIFNEDSCSANIEFIFSSLMDLYQLNNLLNNLQQLIFIRPIIDIHICLPDIILQTFIIHSLNDKIICKKKLLSQRIDNIMICSNHTIRSLLEDNDGVHNQIFVNFQNSIINTIIPFVRHLKLYVDNYIEQWAYMSPEIINTISELTLIIIDNQFECYEGRTFSSILLQNMSNDCHLHFYIECIPNSTLSQIGVDTLSQSFQNNFYTEHQSNVTVGYYHPAYIPTNCTLIIYTSPFCASKFRLIHNQVTSGICSDYTSLTRLILDPCCPNSINILPSNNPLNFLPNLTTLEFQHTPGRHTHQLTAPLNNLFRQIIHRIRHIHFHNDQCSSNLSKYILPLYTFEHLRYIDITDSEFNGSTLSDILQQSHFCRNVFHLNIANVYGLKAHHIKEISMKFTKLQTLKFFMILHKSFQDQLDTISQFILTNMKSHLHYLHIIFKNENIINLSMIPSESQLGDWLGYNQERLLHLYAIELNRNELSAWM